MALLWGVPLVVTVVEMKEHVLWGVPLFVTLVQTRSHRVEGRGGFDSAPVKSRSQCVRGCGHRAVGC